MQLFLVILGLLATGIGFFYPLIQKFGMGNLPGDIYIDKGNLKFYFPISTSLLISCVMSLIMLLINKLR